MIKDSVVEKAEVGLTEFLKKYLLIPRLLFKRLDVFHSTGGVCYFVVYICSFLGLTHISKSPKQENPATRIRNQHALSKMGHPNPQT